MAGPSWLVDGNRFATKIKSASGSCDLGSARWKSNPTRSCPCCHHTIDNSDVAQEWPGLPRGVKFDPTDQEIIQHLLAKAEVGNEKPHPFIDEFIPTVEEEDGICYAHPKNLPGVKQDGTACHFFHRAIKAYNTGTRKRRKIHGDDSGDVRWHKTGRTKPVMLNGVQKGCKKIMVLYVGSGKGGKPEKTNWVMHQYHLGTEDDEKDGQYVISKVFHQPQQLLKQTGKNEEDVTNLTDDIVVKSDPVTPQSVTPQPRNEKRLDQRKELTSASVTSMTEDHERLLEEVRQPEVSRLSDENYATSEGDVDQNAQIENYQGGEENWDGDSQYLLDSQQLVEGLSLCDDLLQGQSPHKSANAYDGENEGKERPSACISSVTEDHEMQMAEEARQPEVSRLSDDNNAASDSHGDQIAENVDSQGGEESKWWDSESQYLMNSQQLVEGLSMCDDLLQSQSPDRNENACGREKKGSIFAEYARLGPNDLKKDLEECQKLVTDPTNLYIDTPPDIRLSQLEFGSQESFQAWGCGSVP